MNEDRPPARRFARRSVARGAGLFVSAVLAIGILGVVSGTGCTDIGARPNVIFIVLDTCRADRLSVNGYERPTSPFLEEYAQDGVRYSEAWSPACWTAPSHASMFTGLRPENHGLVEGVRSYLREESDTLAELLRDSGYRTACFTNNPIISKPMGLAQGFELLQSLFEDESVGYPSAPETHERASRWLLDTAEQEKPFFLFINHMEAHLPYSPPDDAARRFLPADTSAEMIAEAHAFGPPVSLATGVGAVQVPERLRRILSPLYDAEISTIDAELRNLFERLGPTGILDNTLVIIASDHGENLGERGLYDHRFSLNRTLLHVPLIIRRPGHFDGGRVVDDVVRLEDLFPTILESCRAKLPPDLDGRSLIGNVSGRLAWGVHGTPLRYEQALRSAYPQADLSSLEFSWRSVYDGRYHLIRRSDGKEWLYDVENDPGEERNLISQLPDVLAALREKDKERGVKSRD